MNFNIPTSKISGPPGTGKTTYLLGIVEDLLKKKVDPRKIAFVTFTKAGANEAAERAREKFGLGEEDFPWFRTLHSMCLRAVRHKMNNRVLAGKHLYEIGKDLGLSFTFNRYANDFVNNTKGDHILAIYNLHILKRTNLADECKEYSGASVHFPEVRQFGDYYERYKAHHNLIDFSDMLFEFVRGNYQVPVDYVIVDEAQDLSKLQWMVVEKIAKGAKQVWVAGDDDQAIFGWAGASPELLIDLKGMHTVLTQSYRIPRVVHNIAEEITKKLRKRLEKKYAPRAVDGRVQGVDSVDQIKIEKGSGSWLFLARNIANLGVYQASLFSRGLPFTSPFDDDNLRSAREAVLSWGKLTRGELIDAKQAQEVYKFLPVRDVVTYGFKKKIEALDPRDPVDLHTLKSDFGLIKTGKWQDLFRLKPEIKSYLSKADTSGFLQNGSDSRIEINTIHGSKGREAENVVIDLSMSTKTYQGYLAKPDNEHRVFYVGFTRAKENLYIINPKGAKHYKI